MSFRDVMREFTDGTPARMMGSESEYTTQITSPLSERLDPAYISLEEDTEKLWTKSGGKIYLDYGEVVEYATPECFDGQTVALHERIGEIILRNVGDLSSQGVPDGTTTLYPINDVDRWPVYKRTGYSTVYSKSGERLIGSGLSVGHHENYQTGLTKAALETYPNRNFLESYLATRHIWSGAGLVAEHGYSLSQRAQAINFSNNESILHGSKQPFRIGETGILEVRTGEGNMSEWAIKTKFDFTSVILRMIEHNYIDQSLLILSGHETSVMREASERPFERILALGNKSAVEHQLIIAQRAAEFAALYDLPPSEQDAIDCVMAICKSILAYSRNDIDISEISDRVDWAAKLDSMRQQGLKLGQLSTRMLIAVQRDLEWEDISAAGPSRAWYTERQSGFRDDRILHKHFDTPPSEKARRRTQVISSIDVDHIHEVCWSQVTTISGTTFSFDSDALATVPPVMLRHKN